MYKVCGYCDKKFFIPDYTNLQEYTYKHRIGNSWDTLAYFCSYTCWRQGVPENKKKGRYKRL